MTKVVINNCFGGFSLSSVACQDLGINLDNNRSIDRTNPELIKLIETKGSEYCSGSCAKLEIKEFPEPWYEIEEYDGAESVRVFKGPIPESYSL